MPNISVFKEGRAHYRIWFFWFIFPGGWWIPSDCLCLFYILICSVRLWASLPPEMIKDNFLLTQNISFGKWLHSNVERMSGQFGVGFLAVMELLRNMISCEPHTIAYRSTGSVPLPCRRGSSQSDKKGLIFPGGEVVSPVDKNVWLSLLSRK